MSTNWQLLINQIKRTKITFDKSYKCIKLPKLKTQIKHLNILIKSHNDITVLVKQVYAELTVENRKVILNLQNSIKTKLDILFKRLNIQTAPFDDYTALINLTFTPSDDADDTSDSESDANSVDTENDLESITETNTDPTKETGTENTETPSSSNSLKDHLLNYTVNVKMTMTTIEFLAIAAKLLPEFDGKSENLNKFLTALDLIDSIKETHESVAVNLIKTKLSGNASNIITTENTISQIKNFLIQKIKGDSTQVVMSKLLNIKQASKTPIDYAKDIEELAQKLKTAYISDGVPPNVAEKYSTDTAIKAITKNATSDKAKLLMQASQYNSLNEAVAKFVELSADTENTVSIRYMRNQPQSHYRQGYRGRGRRNNNYNNSNQNRYNSNRNRNRNSNSSNYNNNSRNNGNHNNQNNGQRNNRNVRAIAADSENSVQDSQAAQLRIMDMN